MTEGHLQQLLTQAQAQAGDDGWQIASPGCLLTLYAGHASVGLTVSRIEALKVADTFVYARTKKGERFILRLEDVFAGSVDGVDEAKRKAGFV